MTLEDPILAYIARSNEEAVILKQYLESNDIFVEFTEDFAASALAFNPVQGFHQPQIWISRRDSERVVQLLTEYEGIQFEKNEKQSTEVSEVIEVICDDCGAIMVFPSSLAGSVQTCNHCFEYIDIEISDESFGDEEWYYLGEEE